MHRAIDNMLAQVDRVSIERRLEFAALPEGWVGLLMLALVVGLCWIVITLYRREGRRGSSLRARLIMAGLRVAVICALLTIWLQPVLATYLHRLIDSYTIVLIDTSTSMDLQDRYRSQELVEQVQTVYPGAGTEPVRRMDLVSSILQRNDGAFLSRLAANNRVKLYTFDEVPNVAATIRAKRERKDASDTQASKGAPEQPIISAGDIDAIQLNLEALGAATNLGRAVRESSEALGRSPLAGVVVFTDGGINQGDSVDVLGRYVRDREVPLHVVGVGDPSPPRNARVAELIGPDSAFAEDPFAIAAQIAVQGMEDEPITVELTARPASGGSEQIIASKTVLIDPTQRTYPVPFEHQQEGVGRYVYRVRIPPDPAESIADDNAKQVTVNVIENKLKVLLVSGAPSWEYRYLSRLLIRDDTFEVACWLQSADAAAVRDGNVIIDHLPATAEELFAYDAVILLDPDPIELTAEWSELLSRLVSEHGGGMLYAAARLHTPAFMRDPAVQELVKLLPVTLDSDADLTLNEIGHYQQQPSPVIIPSTAVGHPAIALPGAVDGVSSWSTIARVYWHYPVLREKPVATVLMRHGDPRMQNAYGPHVLLASQYVGSGRTAFLAFDGTWRWRAYSENYFNAFWVQTIRYLVEGKLAGGNRRGMLLTERDTYQLGDAITVTARLFDRAFVPLSIEQVEARFAMEGAAGSIQLDRQKDRPGWYEGRFFPPRTGGCELTLAIPDGDPGTGVVRREIQIVRPNLEIVDPRMRQEKLMSLAAQSEGGRYYDVGSADQVPDNIPDRHESTTIRSRPVPLWDDGWVLALLIGLLAIEWTMRKVFRLL